MKKLEAHEKELIGEWIHERGQVRGDETCERILWLISDVLQQVGVDEESGGWDKLFRDPADNRYWLLTYPHSEMHGGGPPALKNLYLSEQEVKNKFISPADWAKRMEKSMRERNIIFVPSMKPRTNPE